MGTSAEAYLANVRNLADRQGVDKALDGGVIASNGILPVWLSDVCSNLGKEPVWANAAGAGEPSLLTYCAPDNLGDCFTCAHDRPISMLLPSLGAVCLFHTFRSCIQKFHDAPIARAILLSHGRTAYEAKAPLFACLATTSQ